ncbi:P-loop containing nucleoside triphosphate hydrolase protein [Pleomassaria siparia CBS 279.74]|uniref:RNA helicase n=1 Tax=Pleomassaria siparia CBS 279.74 TaxID=1314801 RepID=A0A6G1K1S1_9PLEO|nr:P-loop containing nucleoside triphosphate hydrolase protein [Pleomassaria siparia CBS 279.74]
MASRHADSSRTRYDDRERGGARYSAPRREDRYDSYSRDERRDDRRRDDRRDDYRDSNRRGGRFDDRRDRRRSRSPLPRDRSPAPRRDRSRDRYGDDRYRGDRSRTTRDRDRDRGYDDRPRDSRRRDDRGGSYAGGDDRRRGSSSATPSSDVRRGATDKSEEHLSREEKQRREQEKLEKDKEAEKKAKLAKVAEWKRVQAEKKAKLEAENSGAAASSPSVTASSTPAVISIPPVMEAPKTKPQRKSATEKLKQIPKSTFKLDETAKAKPLLSRTAGKPVVSQDAASVTSTYPLKHTTATTSLTDQDRAAQMPKTTGNMSSFGLKTKGDLTTDSAATKSALLDDGDNTGKRTLQALPDFTLDEPSPGNEDDAAMSDIGSDDEETHAQVQAQLEKRREEIAIEDTKMEEDAPVAVDESIDKMDIDDAAGATEEDDVDPLDAFMAGLTETPANGNVPQGQALFADDIEPDMTAVEEEDFLALAASKKKKKEVPVVDHKKVEYESFRKNFYTEPAEVSQMTPEQVADLRLELDGIKVKPDNVPRPVRKWAQMGLLQQTMDVFDDVGYEKPTSIQCQAIPIAESGMDLIGVAKTGSGKTLAFGIPMIRHVLDQRPLKSADGPIVLILAPTRELSLQIVAELKPFLKASNLKIACAYGGPPISEQIAMIKRGGIHVLCATPGRLIDLLQSNSGRVLSFKRITYVVLDEADRMFDMGFEPQVMKILANIRPDRQAILFSATFPKNMAALARKALTKPAEVIIGGRSVVAPEITQVITVVPNSYEKKISQLLLQLGKLFDTNDNAQALIFVEKQETAEDLLARIMRKNYPVNTIHGGKDQTDRTDAINDFKNNVIPILIATSVAARGLDIPELPMVINFDCPTHLEDYVHRCGRTGRAGNKGTAVTFIENPGQERFAVHLIKALRQSEQPIPDDLNEMSKTFGEKVKAGDEKWYDPGFGGKGLDKLDAVRLMEKKREKSDFKGAFKDLGDGDESEDEVELSTLLAPTVKKTEAPAAARAATPGTPGASVADDSEPAYMRLLSGKIIVKKTERPTVDPSKPMSAMERVRAAANKVDGRLSKKGMIHHGQPIDNKGPDAGAYHSTIEINDFPQKARWAVTNRTNVAKILESTGTSITTKGTYYMNGKEPTAEGDLPKLYILVEGDTENVVNAAILELKRLLREATLMAADDASSTRAALPGRYSVV